MIKLKDKEHFLILVFITVVILSVLVPAIIFIENFSLKEIDISNYSFSDNLEYEINEFLEQNNVFIISGWIFKDDEIVLPFDTHIVLYNTETHKYYKANTAMRERTDIPEEDSDRKNLKYTGFISRFSKKVLSKNNRYKVYILYNDILVSINKEIGR